MSRIGNEWEDITDCFFVVINTTRNQQNQQKERYNQQLEEDKKMKNKIKELQKEIVD
jgi:hypothetical protein